jgi:GT2 family glycosyltransferase
LNVDARLSVSVVICCYTEDRWDDLTAAITSVFAQTIRPLEVVAAVDHAPALSARVRAAFPAVKVVDNTGPRGLSGARNTGIDAARGDIVAFLDDDAVAAHDWLERLCAPYADQSVIAVGGRVEPRFDGPRPAWLPPEFDWVVGCTYAGHRETPGEIRNLIGANMSFRRSVFHTIGGFDDRVGRTASLPAGCEETELCIRARQRVPGAIVWYAPSAIVHHRVRPERTTFAYFWARCRAEGVSKMRVAGLVGAQDGLASERTYTTRTLPLASLRDLGLAGTLHGRGALARIGARAVGVGLTGSSYLRAKMRSPRTPVVVDDTFVPALVTQIDLAEPIPALGAQAPNGDTYRRAVVLVREHSAPRDVVEVAIPAAGLDAAEFEMHIRAALATGGTSSDRGVARRLDPVNGTAGAAPHVTVAIATRNRPETLQRCVDSILASRYPSFDIVIVDNAPSDLATEKLVAEWRGEGLPVQYVREDTPGLACAHNAALPYVDAPIVAFTDDDVVVDRDWLHNVAAAFRVADDVACVTGMIFPLELETRVQELVERSVGFNKGMERQVHRVGDADPDDMLFPYAAGRFGSGANMAFRTDVLRALGGFDPALGTGTRAKGGDDLAGFFDVVAAGYTLVYEPAAIVFHAHRRDDQGLARQAFGYGAGLTAYLTKTIVDDPKRVLDLAGRVPTGLRHGLASDSTKNARLPGEYPRSLVRRERVGMLVGPALYLWSRRATRGLNRPSAGARPSALAGAAAVTPIAGTGA